MSLTTPPAAVDRRTFLRGAAAIGGAALAAVAAPGWAGAALAPPAWRDQIGLQLFTVRDRTAVDYPGTLLQVGRIGYREVQTTGSYGAHTPAQIKAYLDAAGLAAPTTHVNPPDGAEFERTLDGYRLIGHRYTTVRFAGSRMTPGATTRAGVQRIAARLNELGRVTRTHGIKVIVHNHTEEFAPLVDSPLLPYDVLLAETDPSLVAMELDIGWATVAGQDALELFGKAPGRFEVWHVKDVAGLAALGALGTQPARQRAARIVPLGEGEIDYRRIFARAEQAGMRHFYVEQDSAPQSGDSLAAAATSYRNLARVLA